MNYKHKTSSLTYEFYKEVPLIFEERCVNCYHIISFFPTFVFKHLQGSLSPVSQHLVSTTDIISKAVYLLFPNIRFQPHTSSPRQLISCFPTFGFNHRHYLQGSLSPVSQHFFATSDTTFNVAVPSYKYYIPFFNQPARWIQSQLCPALYTYIGSVFVNCLEVLFSLLV